MDRRSKGNFFKVVHLNVKINMNYNKRQDIGGHIKHLKII